MVQEKKSKVEQELAAHQQQMRAGSLPISQGSRKILEERQRHAAKAGQAAAALTASGLLDKVILTARHSGVCRTPQGHVLGLWPW